MTYHPVENAFWHDPEVRSLKTDLKYMFLYFMTCPSAHYSGLYYLPFPTIIFESGYSEEQVRTLLGRLSELGKVCHDEENSLVWVVNMAKHRVRSPQQIAGALNHILRLQKSILILKFAMKYPEIAGDIDNLPIPWGKENTTEEPKQLPRPVEKPEKPTRKRTPQAPVQLPQVPEELSTDAFVQVWERWIKHRIEKKAPLTPSMAESQFETFREWGIDKAITVIKHTIFNGWQGLREPDSAGHGHTNGTRKPFSERGQKNLEVAASLQKRISETEKEQ